MFFLVAMYRKLDGDPLPMATFEALGAGQWFRVLTGLLEGAGAIGLLIPPVALFAAIGLAIVMIGAIATHWFVIGGSAALAIVLFLTLMGVAYLLRKK
jgi:membrane protein implicated in regulation of membrane protease activity